MPNYLIRNDKKVAQPAFRVLLYCDGSLNDPENAKGVLALFNLFLEAYGEEAAWIAIADHERKLRPKKLSTKRIEDARSWLATPNKSWPATCRVVGPLSDETHNIVVPAFRVDEYRMMYLDISVPDDLARALPFAEAATEIIQEMPVIACVMGFGFYLPQALESLASWLPRGFERYRTAIEFMVHGATMGIRKTEEGYRWDESPKLDPDAPADLQPGVPDIGWRTIVGAEFLDRLPNLKNALGTKPEVSVEEAPKMTTITTGEEPIWGDIVSGEDISAYQAVAQALAPVRYPTDIAYGSLFGNQYYEPEGRARIRAYLSRFD
ncbi:DUF3396 domain-containing protein [Rhodobacteraceae bacterium 63075]|nr:DUF3396 domain-containing protein [Rhodobacteraceae bacterium 63075]